CMCCGCCYEKSGIPVILHNTREYSRKRTLELLGKLETRIGECYTNRTRFITQLQLEVSLASEEMKKEHENEVLNMLQHTGRGNITLAELRYDIESGSRVAV